MMRLVLPTRGSLRLSLLVFPLVFLLGAAPPRPSAEEITRLIQNLEDEDQSRRQEAAKQLEALDEAALDALQKTATTHPDVDVRLRAAVIARSIASRQWSELKVFGPGAKMNNGYWFNRVAFTPDNKYAIVGGGAVILFDLKTGDEVRREKEVVGARPGLVVSPDGKSCLTSHNNDRFFHLVELPTLKTIQTFSGHTSGIMSVALSPDGKRALSVGSDISVRLWDVETGKELHQYVLPGTGPLCAAFSPDGKHILVGYLGVPSGTIRLLDAETLKPVRSFTAEAGTLSRITFLPGGKEAISAGMDGTIRLWDFETGKVIRTMSHPGGVYDLALSPDGLRALSAGFGDNKVRLWDLRSGTQIYVYDGHQTRVLGVSFSPDGRQALSCDASACVRLWKVGR